MYIILNKFKYNMIFNIILHVTQVFYKIPKQYVKYQFFVDKVKNNLLNVILLY